MALIWSDGFFLRPSHIAVLFSPKIANGHVLEASCFVFYAFDLFSNCFLFRNLALDRLQQPIVF